MSHSRRVFDRVDEDIVDTVTSFIDFDAPRVNPGFGGSSTYNREVGQYTPFRPYLDLQQDLIILIPKTLGSTYRLDWQHADTTKWEDLGKDIMNSQKGYEESKSGFWHRIWYGMGEASDAVDPWIQLIPSDYGLAVVKAGVAVLFKLAEKSKQTKERICDTFLLLRTVLNDCDPSKVGFRSNREVGKYADKLYQAVVDSIRDMITVTTKKEKGIETSGLVARFRRDHKPRPPPPDLDKIVQRVKGCAHEFQRALTGARDEATERTDRNVQGTILGVAMTYTNSKETKQDVKTMATKLGTVDEKIDKAQGTALSIERVVTDSNEILQMIKKEMAELKNIAQQEEQSKNLIAQREQQRQEDDAKLKNDLMSVLLDLERNKRELASRDQEIAELRAQKASPAILRPDQFCAILAGQHSTKDFSKQSNLELSRVLLQRSRFKPQAHGQVNSLVRHDGFKGWLSSANPGLVLINANLPGGGGPGKLSAMSIFSGTLVTSLVSAQPDAVVVQFFCGLHASPSDTEFGPVGLLRSISLQLALKLVALDRLNLDFINELEYLDNLRSPDQMTHCVALCQALYELVSQFPAGTKVYCILDSISWFDRDGTFPTLGVVMECFEGIMEDLEIEPTFKVFLTNAGHASLRLRNLPVFQRRPSRQINLSSRNLTPVTLSTAAVRKHILRPSTPTPGARRHNSGSLRWDSYYEDVDQGFETD